METKENFKLAVIVPSKNIDNCIIKKLCLVMAEESYGMIISGDAVYTEQDLSEFSVERKKIMPLDVIDIAEGNITFFTYRIMISKVKKTTYPIQSLPIPIDKGDTIIKTYMEIKNKATR